MKNISAEVKVGVIAIVIVVLFIWLFNFLKGQNMLKGSDHYYITYDNIAGLETSSPVEISGLKAGVVNAVKLVNDGSGLIKVDISIERDYRIPDNSIAEITTASLIAGMKIDLLLGNSKSFVNPGDMIEGRLAVSLLDKIDKNLDPVFVGANALMVKLDTLLLNLNSLINPQFTGDLSGSAENLNSATGDLKLLLSENSKNLSGLITDLAKLGEMLDKNNERLDSTIYDVSRISSALASSEIETSLESLKKSLDTSAILLNKLNSGQGSAGKFLNDDSLYLNLSSSLNSLNSLLKDMEENPGRYVQFSLFGKKK